MACMDVDGPMDYINEDLLDDDNQEPRGIRADTPPAVASLDLHPWCVQDVDNVHSLLPAEDPPPIPSIEEVKRQKVQREADASIMSATGGGHDPESEYDASFSICSLAWTKLHAGGTGRTISCGPLPPLANLSGSTMKNLQEDFNAQNFETTFRDENDEVVVIRFVAQPLSEADESTVIGSPTTPNTPSSPPDSPSSAYHLPYDSGGTSDSSTVHSPSTCQDRASPDICGDPPPTRAEYESVPSDKLESQGLEDMASAQTNHDSDVALNPAASNCTEEACGAPDTPPKIQIRLPSVPPQPMGVPPHVKRSSVDDTITRPPSSESLVTERDPASSEEPSKRGSPKRPNPSRTASLRQEPNIRCIKPDIASGNFVRYEPPRVDGTMNRGGDRSEEISDSEIGFDPETRLFFCRCGRPFSRKNDVRRHFRSASYHKAERQNGGRRVGVKGVQCRHCGEELSRPDARRRHEKVKACGKRSIRQPNGYTPMIGAAKYNLWHESGDD